MNSILNNVREDMEAAMMDWSALQAIRAGEIFVVGCSTSEVIGEAIGSAGSEEVAREIFTHVQRFAQNAQVFLAFQCCEHLNRALVVERKILEKYPLEEVSVKPVRDAGGSMATYAYEHTDEPIVVEAIQAHAGIDIGDTFIGMHLKHVVVPVRLSVSSIGNAHMTIAKTRPKLIGGTRAVYI